MVRIFDKQITNQPSPGWQGTPWLHILAAALVLTALNAIKPVHIDDFMYLSYGAEFAAHPLDPYAFRFGSPYLLPANVTVAVPPVVPYWLGAEIALFGDHPILLKCGLLPFALLLAWAVDFLAARLACSLRVSVVWFSLMSPTVLPGFNMMFDVPMLALGLAALAVVIRSTETNSYALVLLAGLLAALAIQTKYTGLIECAAVVAWCVLRKRPTQGLIVAAIALALIVAWEWWIARTQGDSHFLVQFRLYKGHTVSRAVHIALPLVSQAAGLAPGIALLGMVALGWKHRSILIAGLTIVVGLAVLAVIPSETALLTAASGRPILTPTNLVYAVQAVIVWGVLGLVCIRLARREDPDASEKQLTWFLLVWLALELGGYFALSPHPAARRLNGLVLVFTFLSARLAYLEGIRPRFVSKLCACGVALALLFYITDWHEARAGQLAAHETAKRRALLAEGGTFWHLGWWGFGYYAQREGMRPLQLNRQAPRPGDLLAVLDALAFRRYLANQRAIDLEPIETVVVRDAFPLRTVPGYYAGRTPLDHQSNGRSPVIIYRITAAVPGL